jgi:hypothetical protein
MNVDRAIAAIEKNFLRGALVRSASRRCQDTC